MREATDRSRESSSGLWNVHGRLSLGVYGAGALFGLSLGAANLGAAPAQVSTCTLPAATGGELTCTSSYLASYNRTRVLDVRLEYRRGFDIIGFNPAVQLVFQKSREDDPATANDDRKLGPRTLDLDLPFFLFVRRYGTSPVAPFAGMRGVLRKWLVERPREWELMGGIFVGVAYDGVDRVHRPREQEFFE